MATISEIVQEQSYRGDVALGSGSSGVIALNTQPLDDLAKYTYLAHKAEWDQKQIDMQQQAKEMASLTAYDVVAIPEESKILRAKVDKLFKYVGDNNDVLDYKNNKSGYIGYLKMKNDLNNELARGKERNVIYEARVAEVEKAPTPGAKRFLKKKLDEDVKKSGIGNPMPHSPFYDLKPIKVQAAPRKTFDVIKKGGNGVIDRELNIKDMSSVRSQAAAAISGLAEMSNPKDQDEKDEFEARMAFGTFEPVKSAQLMSEAIQQLPVDANGKRDFSSAPSLLAGPVEMAMNFNREMQTIKEDIKNGAYEDKLGSIGFGGQRGLKESDYQEINIEDGISPEELAVLRIHAASAPDTYDTKYSQTDDALQNAQLAETIAGRKSGNALRQQEINLSKERLAIDRKKAEDEVNKVLGVNPTAVSYWDNYLSNQLNPSLWVKGEKKGFWGDTPGITANHTGDVKIETSKVAGLQMAIFGERTSEGKEKSINEDTKVEVRLDNGKPTGLIIDGVFYDKNIIDSKAIENRDKFVNNKLDISPLSQTPSSTPAPTSKTIMADDEYKKILLEAAGKGNKK